MNKITVKVMQEIIDHEAIICEAYKDSVGVWTWGVGVTTKSGHAVERYKDNPQSVARVIEIFEWLLREKYAPSVFAAFKCRDLTEAQFTAALSFHYNTGQIGKAMWVKSWLAGDRDKARLEFMNYRKPAEIIPRRTKERDLFFDGVWHGTGKATIYGVRKPSYQPSWSSAKRVDITADLVAALA
jgi:GH24 family phage-related lysozyme (muramidase)